jgi:hypothetical protein
LAQQRAIAIAVGNALRLGDVVALRDSLAGHGGGQIVDGQRAVRAQIERLRKKKGGE